MILLHREKPDTKLATGGLLGIGLIVAMGLWWAFLKRGIKKPDNQ